MVNVCEKNCIRTEDLNLWFGDNHILKDISISVPQKRVDAIIGPSGCGKSTLLRCFNRMNDLSGARIEGNIVLDGNDIYKEKIDIYDLRMRVGMVFQKPNPFPKSIYENVAFGLRIKGKKNKSFMDAKVEDSLRNVWLWDEVKDRLNDSAFNLSGGQQQRLCIARALAVDPEVILLDEPTSALDPKSTSKIEELIVELKNSVTILIVTHNIAQAGRISDYTTFLYLGELIEFGQTKDIFTVPKDERTEQYLTGKFG